jgi:hypothetical protein
MTLCFDFFCSDKLPEGCNGNITRVIETSFAVACSTKQHNLLRHLTKHVVGAPRHERVGEHVRPVPIQRMTGQKGP